MIINIGTMNPIKQARYANVDRKWSQVDLIILILLYIALVHSIVCFTIPGQKTAFKFNISYFLFKEYNKVILR